MAEKKIVVKSKRLIMEPASDAEIREMIEACPDEEMKIAYGEMLAGCEADPENRIWYCPWKMIRKSDGQMMGDIGFKGPAKLYSVEIGYGIEKAYENQGYTSEAVAAMTDWAFTMQEVYYVEAEADPENKASTAILKKNGFTEYGHGEEGIRYEKEKAKYPYMPIYMCFGVSIGMAFGNLFGSASMGMCFGIAVGVAVGALLDRKMNAKLEAARAERAEGKKVKEDESK